MIGGNPCIPEGIMITPGRAEECAALAGLVELEFEEGIPEADSDTGAAIWPGGGLCKRTVSAPVAPARICGWDVGGGGGGGGGFRCAVGASTMTDGNASIDTTARAAGAALTLRAISLAGPAVDEGGGGAGRGPGATARMAPGGGGGGGGGTELGPEVGPEAGFEEGGACFSALAALAPSPGGGGGGGGGAFGTTGLANITGVPGIGCRSSDVGADAGGGGTACDGGDTTSGFMPAAGGTRVAAGGRSCGFTGAGRGVVVTGVVAGAIAGPAPMRIVFAPAGVTVGAGGVGAPRRRVCAPIAGAGGATTGDGVIAFGGRDGMRTAETRSESSNAAQNSPAPGQRSFGDSASARRSTCSTDSGKFKPKVEIAGVGEPSGRSSIVSKKTIANA